MLTCALEMCMVRDTWWLVGIVVGLFGTPGCGAPARGTSDAAFAAAEEASAQGAQVYREECASCHGPHGQGSDRTPPLMGRFSLPLNRDPNFFYTMYGSLPPTMGSGAPGAAQGGVRESFVNAYDLYQFISRRMPAFPGRAGTLASYQYWSVLNFILRARGNPLPAEGANAQNARTIPIR